MTIKKLALQVKVAGMMGGLLKLATVELLQQPTEPELKDWTELVCPNDFKKPKYVPATYKCECGFEAQHWSKLLRVKAGTTTEVEIPKLTREGDIQTAMVTQMAFADFVEAGYADALPKEDAERPIRPLDDTSEETLNKLLVANQMDKTAIIVKWNDSKEEKIALLTTSPSGKVVLRRIIPSNLVQVKTLGMQIDPTKIGELTEEEKTFLSNPCLDTLKSLKYENIENFKSDTAVKKNFEVLRDLIKDTALKRDLEEARTFLKQHVPKAKNETFEVKDYRVQALTIEATTGNKKIVASQKQASLKELMQQQKAQKQQGLTQELTIPKTKIKKKK